MDELLSLKWKNHQNGFLKLLNSIRKKNTYTDVTLACDGELYNAHKIVLSASSDYFNQIFQSVLCPNPVIVLKDITGRNLEVLLDYMYLGETNVRQSELSSLMQAAECLKLKGLAVPDSDITDNNVISGSKKKLIDASLITDDSVISGSKRKSLDLCPKGRKRFRSPTTSESLSSRISNTQEKTTETNINDSVYLSETMKTEDNSDDIMNIKTETEYITESIFAEDGNDLNFDTNEHNMSTKINSTIDEDDTTQAYFIMNEIPYLRYESTLKSAEVACPNEENCLETMQFDTDSHKSRVCPICTKVSSSPADCRRHIRVHTKEKPFKCPLCSHKAAEKCRMKLHIITKHSDIQRMNPTLFQSCKPYFKK